MNLSATVQEDWRCHLRDGEVFLHGEAPDFATFDVFQAPAASTSVLSDTRILKMAIKLADAMLPMSWWLNAKREQSRRLQCYLVPDTTE